ncbi:MAG: hypothetical protein K6F66_04510, partial [Pseudobutyrivibrio sp.]|nr:hypothetical protein [Pseudobutyrivibrio sp.]
MKSTWNKKVKNKQILTGTLLLIVIAFALVVIGYIYLWLRNGYTITDLIENIVGNLIGVLAAFLLFDIIYNKLTQDAYAKDTSQQIAKTLMGDSDILDAFSYEDKNNFITSTIKSMVKDEDALDVIDSRVKTFLDFEGNYKIRKSFNYAIAANAEEPNSDYSALPGNNGDNYFYVQENLNYEVKCIKGQNNSIDVENQTVKIAFLFDKKTLDESMLKEDKGDIFKNCIFSENLDINQETLQYFASLSEQELKETIQRLFTPVVKIDGVAGSINEVFISESGIVIKYNVLVMQKDEYSVRVIFHMPKLWNSIFEVALVDATKSPKILFDYNPSKMDVSMYSFINKEIDSN